MCMNYIIVYLGTNLLRYANIELTESNAIIVKCDKICSSKTFELN